MTFFPFFGFYQNKRGKTSIKGYGYGGRGVLFIRGKDFLPIYSIALPLFGILRGGIIEYVFD
jgi:hypothetical protein